MDKWKCVVNAGGKKKRIGQSREYKQKKIV